MWFSYELLYIIIDKFIFLFEPTFSIIHSPSYEALKIDLAGPERIVRITEKCANGE